MFSAQESNNAMRAVYERGLVDCEKCRAPIVVNKPGAVSVEFCVPCHICGHRGMYFKRMIYIEGVAERRQQVR